MVRSKLTGRLTTAEGLTDRVRLLVTPHSSERRLEARRKSGRVRLRTPPSGGAASARRRR